MDKCYEDAGKDVFNMNADTDLKKKEVWDLCLLFYNFFLFIYSFITIFYSVKQIFVVYHFNFLISLYMFYT